MTLSLVLVERFQNVPDWSYYLHFPITFLAACLSPGESDDEEDGLRGLELNTGQCHTVTLASSSSKARAGRKRLFRWFEFQTLVGAHGRLSARERRTPNTSFAAWLSRSITHFYLSGQASPTKLANTTDLVINLLQYLSHPPSLGLVSSRTANHLTKVLPSSVAR